MKGIETREIDSFLINAEDLQKRYHLLEKDFSLLCMSVRHLLKSVVHGGLSPSMGIEKIDKYLIKRGKTMTTVN